jgi:RNA polymerase sigma factor (sigma-70 family)
VRRIGHRHGLRPEEREELLGAMHLKLVENDYDALRRFEGRASFATYLSAVVARHLLDERNARWGKWRPSLYARRHGPVAVHLERLLTRDGLSFGEAVETLRSTLRVTESEAELYEVSLGFPARARRRFVPSDVLVEVPDPASSENGLERERRSELAERTAAALRDALNRLHDADRVLLRMCFEQELPLVAVARALQVDQKSLYRRRAHVLAALRRSLEQQGISATDIREIIGTDLEPPGEPSGGNSSVVSV